MSKPYAQVLAEYIIAHSKETGIKHIHCSQIQLNLVDWSYYTHGAAAAAYYPEQLWFDQRTGYFRITEIQNSEEPFEKLSHPDNEAAAEIIDAMIFSGLHPDGELLRLEELCHHWLQGIDAAKKLNRNLRELSKE